jgi:hypothetical protein
MASIPYDWMNGSAALATLPCASSGVQGTIHSFLRIIVTQQPTARARRRRVYLVLHYRQTFFLSYYIDNLPALITVIVSTVTAIISSQIIIGPRTHHMNTNLKLPN